jgi:cell division protein FtsL
MSPRSAAAAVARTAAGTIHAPGRPYVRPRPAPPRRRSGAAARPRTATRAPARRDFVTVLDRLLRGPVYIAAVGILLVGIVFFNVDVLELNHGIARTDARAAQLKRENAALTLQLAKLGSSERIQLVALQRGLVLPQPGDVGYLRAHRQDASRALRVMTAPDASGATAGVAASVPQSSSAAAAVTGQTTAGTTTAQPAASTGQTLTASPAATPSAG